MLTTYPPKPESIASLVRAHGIETTVTETTVKAFDVVYGRNGEDLSQWVDLTGMTAGAVYRWLGY